MSRGNGYQKGCRHKGVIISIDANLPLPISWKVHAMFISRFYCWAGYWCLCPVLLRQSCWHKLCCWHGPAQPGLLSCTAVQHLSWPWPCLGLCSGHQHCHNQEPETPHACAPSYRRIALESQRFFLFFWEWGRGWDAAAAGEEYVSGAAMT